MPAPAPFAKRTNSLAVVSLIGGIASYMGVLCAGALVGIICGPMARAQIKRTGEEGNGLALAGMILGYAHIAIVIVVVAFWILLFGGLAAIGLANAH